MTNTTNIIPIGLIQTAFESEHYPHLFSGQQTDTPAFSMIGQLVHHTQDAHLIKQIIISGLPADYDGDTISQLDSKIERTLEKGWHEEEMKEQKGVTDLLIDLVEEKGCILFHDSFDVPLISFVDSGKTKTYPLHSTAAKRRLQLMFYTEFGRPMQAQSFKLACDILEAKALFDGDEKLVNLRVAGDENTVILNLATNHSEVIIIDKNGYEITNNSPAIFISSPSMEALPKPIKGTGSALRQFQQLLNIEDHIFARILAFLINCLSPTGPYLCMIVEGEQGSGKSFLTECCKMIIDPSMALKMSLPNNVRDLMIQTRDNHLMLFDNVSKIKAEISDALCCLSTGGGFSTRSLYTNDELTIFNQKRPFILNGISAYATRQDLLERSISIYLNSMPEGQRKSERDMRRAFEDLRPAILAELYEIVCHAIRNYDNVETPTTVRMADAARWLVAAEPGTWLPAGSFLKALEESQLEIVRESLARNSLAIAIIKLAEEGTFDGTMGQLLNRLEGLGNLRDRYFPSTAAHLSSWLDRLRPGLKKIGILVEHGPKARVGRLVKITLSEDYSQGLATDTPRTPTPEGGIEV